MLLVVRQNYCDRVVLTDAARQFQFIRAKIIGTVFNCTSEHSGSYSKAYYKRYYRRYYSRYRKSNYENNDRSVTQPEDNHSKVRVF
jgi:Mrp family chromosome partitioning ATPase